MQSKNDAVWVEGRLRQRPYYEKDESGKNKGPRHGYFHWIRASKVYLLQHFPQVVRQGEQYLIPAGPWDRLSAAMNSGGPPEMSQEEFDEIFQKIEERKERFGKNKPPKRH